MIRLDAQKATRFCDGMSRRDFLHAGALATIGLTLPQFMALEALGAVEQDDDRNCVMIFLLGGPSQLDTFDMKPDAPAEVRGPFKPIKTNAPGIEICEVFPRMAKLGDKFSLVRTVNHGAAAVHDTGHQMMQTGRLFSGGIEYPHAGAVLEYLRGSRKDAPAHVLMPRPMGPTGGNLPHGQSAGYLGKKYDPFVLNADPSDKNFKVRDLRAPATIGVVREDRRKKLRNAVDGLVKSFESSADAKQLDENFQKAYSLMSSKTMREAFDLKKEPAKVRERYGMNKFGQSCLLTRRLLERGVRFATINMFETVFNEITWDIHGSRPFTSITDIPKSVGPWYDNGYSSLIEDLHDRGMLDNTLVVSMGEFGRTPKINPAGGRDHWPQCWSVNFAGGGVQGGRVVGESDEMAAFPKDRAVSPAEVTATIFHALGIRLEKVLPGPNGQPIPVADFGVEPIHELF